MRLILLAGLIAAVSKPAHTRDENQRTVGGALWGSIVGGYLGSNVGQGRGRTAATIAGAMVGAGVGDRMQNENAYEPRGYAGQAPQQYAPPPPATFQAAPGGYRNSRGGYYESREPTLHTHGDTVTLD